MENSLLDQIKAALSPSRRELLERIVATADCPVYIVGGVVRDALLGLPTFDLDLVTEADAPTLAQQIAADGQVRVVVHQQFRTAKLTLPNTEAIDLVTARSEHYPSPSALPVVKPGTIRDDILRRDFTINSLALQLPDGGLLDLTNKGVADLNARLVRALHAQSFLDDATRLLRAVRYEQRFGFKLEPGTLKQLRFFRTQIQRLSGERVRHELERTLDEQEPERGVLRLAGLKLLEAIEPALRADAWLAEAYRRAREYVNQEHTSLLLLRQVYWCLLVYHNSPPELERIIERLRLDAKTSTILREVIQLRVRAEQLHNANLKRSTIYHLLAGSSPAARVTLAAADPEAAPQIHLYERELATVVPRTGGKELRARGLPTGPVYKQIIEVLRDAWLDGQISSESEEEAVLDQFLRERGTDNKND